jgi:hypothetical protein
MGKFNLVRPEIRVSTEIRTPTPQSTLPDSRIRTEQAVGLLLEGGKLFTLKGRLISRFVKPDIKARSSAGEHFPDTEGVGGSIPPVPTKYLMQSHLMNTAHGRASRS